MDIWSLLLAVAAVAGPLALAWCLLAWSDRRKSPTRGPQDVSRR